MNIKSHSKELKVNMLKKFEAGKTNEILGFVSSSLKKSKLNPKEISHAELMCEEALMNLIEHGDFTKKNFISVNVRKFLGDVSIELKVPGNEFDFFIGGGFSFNENYDDDNVEAIRNLILSSFGNQIKYKHQRNCNTVKITAFHSQYSALYQVLAALFLSVATGILMKNFCSPEVCAFVNENFFNVIKSFFMNGLMMSSVPIVFFAVILCIADSAVDFSQMKRVGMKLFCFYEAGHVISALAGIFIVWLFGTGRGAGLIASAASEAAKMPFSIHDTFMNIMPKNLLEPFIKTDMLQLIVIGIFVGITAKINAAKTFTAFADETMRIFAGIAGYLLKFSPLIVFCSVASIVLTTGVKTMLSVLGILFAMLSATFLLTALLCLMIFFMVRLNPLIFIKKSMTVLINSFSTGSSNAVMPDAMKSLEEMGVSRDVYSLAIPLGMVISKLASPMYMFVSILSVANMYGIEISFMEIISLSVSIILIVPLVPGLPGMMLTTMSFFFASVGCPVEGIAFIMALDTIAGMIIKTPLTALGITAPALIIAGQENLIDTEKYGR